MNKKVKFNLNFLSSIFAAPVIIGALFKILHLPGAKELLIVGMTFEAIIFILMAFQKQAEEPDWSIVYPELLDPDKRDENAVSRPSAGGGSGIMDQLIMSGGNIEPETIAQLGEGLKNFGSKVANISQMADMSQSARDFNQALSSATYNVSELGEAYKMASNNLISISEFGSGATEYKDEISRLIKNVSSLNLVYEQELHGSEAYLKSINKFYTDMDQIMVNVSASVEPMREMGEEVNRFNRNLSALNAVYGRMLSAINDNRNS
ncbi:MAG: gliding motility protein GldL [Solitalea-like symbiont of Acarus siro]